MKQKSKVESKRLESYQLQKNPSLRFEKRFSKIDHISPIFILFFFSKTKLVLKFNSVLVGILDNFGHNLFTCLPSDYHLLFH